MTLREKTLAAVECFHRAVNSRDVDALLAAITADCHFESTLPPDSDSYDGAAAIGAFFRGRFDASLERKFEVEELVLANDRAVMRWSHS